LGADGTERRLLGIDYVRLGSYPDAHGTIVFYDWFSCCTLLDSCIVSELDGSVCAGLGFLV